MRNKSRINIIACYVAAFMLALLPVCAMAGNIEITPFAGYTMGGDFSNTATGQSLSLDETASYGIMLGFKQAADPKQPGTSWVELYVSRQPTQLKLDSASTLKPSLDLDIEYYHVGGTYGQAEGTVQPFVAGSLGATRMVPQQYGLDSETNFSLSLGGGVKMYLTKHVGLRLEGRWFGTLVDTSGGMFCSNGACLVTVQGDVFSQFVANAGLIFAF